MAAFEISLGILRLGTYFKLYEELTAHWREILPGIVCEFAYENVIADQKRETADLLRYRHPDRFQLTGVLVLERPDQKVKSSY